MKEPEPFFLEKVTALITRHSTGGAKQLLLIRHPYAGVQIPAGTVELGEAPAAAARREACEETGLCDLRLVHLIGYQDDRWADDIYFIVHNTTVYARPDPTSFDWAHLPRGAAVRSQRQAPGWLHVTYEEPDRWPDPRYTTYQISGWVPAQSVAEMQRRYFYHLEYGVGCKAPDPNPDGEWEVFTDNHTFKAFWTPLDHLPAIAKPQDAWLDYVINQLGYNFMEPFK